MEVEGLDDENHDQIRALILAGLRDRLGELDPALNRDLDDLRVSYGHGRTVAVRDDAGRIVGTGTLVPRGDATAEIVRMSVAEAARRSGIGRLVVEDLLATARTWGTRRVVLETTSSWTGAIRFYQSCGFEITHVEDDRFGSNTWFVRHLDG
ncbi:MAG: GNAT family N-acetyltransferase [Actinomycetota bacterium]